MKPEPGIQRVYLILNPIAGSSSAEEIRELVEENFREQGWDFEIYETTGAEDEDVAEIARTACKQGADLVIAAGGDGTVAGVVNGLVHADIPLGIIPVGTGNGLARSLSIPLEIEDAVKLITGEHTFQSLDAMKVEDQYFVLNVSAGISSRTMDSTPSEQKRRFGILAYLWTITRQLAGIQPRRFLLTVDDHQVEVQAAEILVSNGSPLKEPPFLLGPVEALNDGVLEAHILTARSLWDYLRLGWQMIFSRKERKQELRTLTVKKGIRLESAGRPESVQADGELIGETPVEIEIVPDALRVIVPKPEED